MLARRNLLLAFWIGIAFGPVEVLASRIEEYAKGGGSKFILRPLCPPSLMLEQLAFASEHVIPEYHRR